MVYIQGSLNVNKPTAVTIAENRQLDPNQDHQHEQPFMKMQSTTSTASLTSSATDGNNSISNGTGTGIPLVEATTGSMRKAQSYVNIMGMGSRTTSCASLTYAAQGRLPRLPIPTLEETLAKFPRVVQVLLTDKQRDDLQGQLEEFRTTDGPVLQKALVEYEQTGVASGKIGSYVEEFWNESYLSPDASVVLNLNPYFVLEKGPDPKTANDPLRRAAQLTFASAKLASLLRHQTLSPDIFKGKPLCMDQFKVLFGSSRQPVDHTGGDHMLDDIHVYNDSSHVAVICRNQFYYFPVLWPDTGRVAVDEADILDILKAIQQHAEQTDPAEASLNAIGVLTSLPRSEWAQARAELCRFSDINQTSLHVVDSALFVLVLDNYVPATASDTAANMLHGSSKLATRDEILQQQQQRNSNNSHHPSHCQRGNVPADSESDSQSGSTSAPENYSTDDTIQVGTCLNRWYDKLQLIVCKDGTAGVNFEHSAIDGHTALRFVSDIYAETIISFAESITQLIHGAGSVPHVIEAVVERASDHRAGDARPKLCVFPKKLIFELSESIQNRIFYAETALSDQIIANDSVALEFQDYGKSLIVGNKISPDAFVQASIMLAYYKLYGRIVCTYEPVLTKSFYHGRTEAMRSATPEAKHMCEIWTKRLSTPQDKLEALRAACQVHSKLCQESAQGHGVDRHLFALQCMAEKLGMPQPAFFRSAAWKTLNHSILSTSNCGNPSLRLFGFGPVVQNGFGIGYIIKDHGLSYAISSKHRQTKRYAMALERILHEMKSLLKPLSDVHVSQHHPYRPAMLLKEVKIPAPVLSTYEDMFGVASSSFMVAEAAANDNNNKNDDDKKKKENPKTFYRQGSSSFTPKNNKRASIHIICSMATPILPNATET